MDRKSAILLDILTAGGQVEQKLSQHASEVDGVMLRLLERRIETAKRYGSGSSGNLDIGAFLAAGCPLLCSFHFAAGVEQVARPAVWQLFTSISGSGVWHLGTSSSAVHLP